jgi:hypothetical protein
VPSYKAQDFIDAIPGTGGIISAIAKKVGCTWHTAKAAIDRYQTVREAYDDECEVVTDVAESTVIKAIRDGDVPSAKWWLTKKGKERGFAEKVDLEGQVDITSGGRPVGPDFSAMTDDELREILADRSGKRARSKGTS